MSRFPSFVTTAFYWLVGVTFALGILLFPLEFARQFLIVTGCYTKVLAKVSGVSGFDFEVSETECWHSPAISVFVSQPGRTKKTRLLQYTRTRGVDPVPIITSTDEHTALISLSSAGTIDCRRDKWKTLTVRYNIGPVVHTGLQAQPPEC